MALSWTATTTMPSSCRHTRPLAYRGFMYVIGGLVGGGSAVTTAQYAPINADGSLGSWSTTTAFPTDVRLEGLVASGDYMYAVGGLLGNTPSTAVYRSLIDANGTLGTWSATGSLSVARYNHQSTVAGSYVMTTGGVDSGFVETTSVNYQLINGNGTLGAGTATTVLPAVKSGGGSCYYNSRLYVLGGNAKTYSCVLSSGAVSGGWRTEADSLYNSVSFNVSQPQLLENVIYSYSVGADGLGYPKALFRCTIAGNGTVSWNVTSNDLPYEPSMLASYNGKLYAFSWVDAATPTQVRYSQVVSYAKGTFSSRGGFSAGINSGFN